MSIKTGESITASDLTNLKTKILTMYNNRTVNFGVQLSGTNSYKTAVSNSSFTAGSSITGNPGIGALINACLVINDIPNLKWTSNSSSSYIQPTGGTVFGDGTATEILSGWLTNAKRDATGTSSSHGCRGACLGICSSGCSTTATGTTGGTLGTACNGCSSGCFGSCGSTCLGGVKAECDCVGCCRGGCSGSCGSSACKYNCAGSCAGGCGTGCYSGCSSGCQTTCKDYCATTCAAGCYGSATGGCYGCSSKCVSSANAHS